ncbi:MAG: ABC transporter permease subunit [Acidobacteria bacterium]|nr:ABC transporter permease subunit [Acidobacteriota bacterium]
MGEVSSVEMNDVREASKRLFRTRCGVRGMWAIYKKELRGYFVSPIAYVVLTVFYVLMGYFFFNFLAIFSEQALYAAYQAAEYGNSPPAMDVPAQVDRNYFGILSTVLIFFLPALTMGMFAEERRRGTLELLLTAPLKDGQIILGKFLAAMTVFLLMLLPTAVFQVVLHRFSDPPMAWGAVLASYIGAVLLGASLISIGVFISSITENQIIAAVLTFGCFLLMWVIEIAARQTGTLMSEVLKYLSVLSHYEDFTKGIVDSGSVLFLVSLCVLGLLFTYHSFISLRWRM